MTASGSLLLIYVFVCLVAIAGGVWFWMQWRATPLPPVRPMQLADVRSAPLWTKPSWIDGRTLLPDAEQPRAIAVSIDNAPEARPQTGIADAPLVFEVPVEGQRTRFLALYPASDSPPLQEGSRADEQQQLLAVVRGETGEAMSPKVREQDRRTLEGVVRSADKSIGDRNARSYAGSIGPIRSVRPYCIGIANALGVPIVHAGGSPAAIALLKNIPHVDEWFGTPFTRARSRVPPFNLYATVEGLAAYFTDHDQRGVVHSDTWKLWEYTPTSFDGERNGTSVALRYGGERVFDVSWTYDTVQGVYVRSQGGTIHRDIDGDAVTAKNVVVLRVESAVLDRVGRIAIPQLEARNGTGAGTMKRLPVEVYSDGQRSAGSWTWENPEGDAGLFGLRHEPFEGGDSATMAPILLLPGTTWVEVVNF